MLYVRCSLAAVLFLVTAMLRAAEEYEQEPIKYSATEPDNPVSRLSQRIDAGEAKLTHEPEWGYLRSLLKELQIPESSQTLVYSKTSLQRHRIAPRTPRAIYFNDDTYVGYCRDGDVLEISTADPRLGTVFYTLPQADERPSLARQGDNCLICHAGSQTKQVPGHTLRSMYVDGSGLPLFASGTYRIDQTSPLETRWGGWYVTGTHGEQKHLGNLVIRGRNTVPRDIDLSANMNVPSLEDYFDPSAYLHAHSDIVAHLVLAHQVDAHNFLTRANFQTRQALHYRDTMNRSLGESSDHEWPSVTSRIKSAAEELVEYFLFCEEAPISAPIKGSTKYAEEFARLGPRDAKGRSLRDFDLTKRTFKYPCSYLIYSPSFAALPAEARDTVLQRLWDVLNGADEKKFANLSTDDRLAICEILQETLPKLPAYWDTGSPTR